MKKTPISYTLCGIQTGIKTYFYVMSITSVLVQQFNTYLFCPLKINCPILARSVLRLFFFLLFRKYARGLTMTANTPRRPFHPPLTASEKSNIFFISNPPPKKKIKKKTIFYINSKRTHVLLYFPWDYYYYYYCFYHDYYYTIVGWYIFFYSYVWPTKYHVS